jgi:DNA-binding LacI/PurR family transcriptional regulator
MRSRSSSSAAGSGHTGPESFTRIVNLRATRTASIRRVLRKAGISFQKTKTWKHSNDPEFVTKKDGILALCARPPTAVICIDEGAAEPDAQTGVGGAAIR